MPFRMDCLFQTFVFLFVNIIRVCYAAGDCNAAEDKAESKSENDSTIILLVIGLLIATVLTIWLFKVKRFRFMHETGLCIIYGMLAGLIIKYTGGVTNKGHVINLNVSEAPKTLWATLKNLNESYSYSLRGILHTRQAQGGALETKAVFDPEVFFYALLPPIIFFAGYDMKKRFFFRNLGAILTFAFVGTTISCMVFAGLIYLFVYLFGAEEYGGFSFTDSLLFGSLISATDPVTILAIFHDLHVDVDLYAMVFGESVMNDAVAIVLYKSIQSYQCATFHSRSFFQAVGMFIGIFGGSFLLGSFMGLFNALLAKLTKIGEFPRLETALFVLVSYSTFLIAEVAGLTGIVTVLFCGISQAHYTYNNLSKESQVSTKEIFGLLNFLAENFIFSYMGLTVFTFEQHQWKPGFIAWTFLAIAISRFCNIYPLSFLMNLKRSKKIPWKFQHMLFFAGLRGAVAFALAIRNTEGIPRQLVLTSVLVVTIVTVVFNGGLTTYVLLKLGIRVNVDPDEDITTETTTDEHGGIREDISYERSWLVRKWHEFDIKYMKPLFTSKGGPVTAALPSCCHPVAERLTAGHDVEERYERHGAPMDEIGSIDDEMIDVSGEVMTKSPSRNLSQEDAQQSTGGTSYNLPMNLIT